MWHVDDGELHAYLDGELDAVAGARRTDIEAHLAVCERCGARLDQARRYRNAARSILRAADPGAGEAPPFETILRRARGDGALSTRPWWRSPRILAWAASVTLAIGAGWFAHAALGPSTAREAEMALRPSGDTGTERSALQAPREPALDVSDHESRSATPTAPRTDATVRSERSAATPESGRLAAASIQDTSSDTPSPTTGTRAADRNVRERTRAATDRNDEPRTIAEPVLAVGPGTDAAERTEVGIAPTTFTTDSATLDIAEPQVRVARSIDVPAGETPSVPPVAAAPLPTNVISAYADGIVATSPQHTPLQPAPGETVSRSPTALGRRSGTSPLGPEQRQSSAEQREAAEAGRLLSRVVSAIAGAIDGKGPDREAGKGTPTDGSTVPTVRGLVLEEGNGAALIGTQVLLIAEDGHPVRTTRADLAGAFVFRDVEPGTYHVAANRAGYELRPRRIVVEERGDVVLELRMRPVPPDDGRR